MSEMKIRKMKTVAKLGVISGISREKLELEIMKYSSFTSKEDLDKILDEVYSYSEDQIERMRDHMLAFDSKK